MARRLRDQVVGELRFVDYWERSETIKLFGREFYVTMMFDGEPDEELDESQREAFIAFKADQDGCLARAERALLDYYARISPEVRERLGDSADQLAPAVSTGPELIRLLTPTHLSFPLDFPDDGRVAGLILDCTWDPGRGVGLKWVNEEVREVGTQDVIL